MKKNILSKGAVMIFCAGMSLASTAQKQASTKVNIIEFKLKQNQNKISVNWATDNNVPTNYFEVERSNDGKNFKPVAYILGADPQKTDCDCYGFSDKVSPDKKQFYYRLKHVDTNGQIEFSETRILALKN